MKEIKDKYGYCPVFIKRSEAEEKWLKENATRIKNKIAWNYSIIKEGELIGGIGVHIDSSGSNSKAYLTSTTFTSNYLNIWSESSTGGIFANWSTDVRSATLAAGSVVPTSCDFC